MAFKQNVLLFRTTNQTPKKWVFIRFDTSSVLPIPLGSVFQMRFIAKWIDTLILSNQLDEIPKRMVLCSDFFFDYGRNNNVFLFAEKNRILFKQIDFNWVEKEPLHFWYDFQHNANVNVFHSTSTMSKNSIQIIAKIIRLQLIFLFGMSPITHFWWGSRFTHR